MLMKGIVESMACVVLGPASRLWLVLSLAGSAAVADDASAPQGGNHSSLLQADAGAYLRELAGYWPFNDSLQLSRFEEFDHTHFDDPREASTPGPPPGGRDPVFDNDLVTNVTAQLGGAAFLRCRVRHLGERPVSWVRRRDWHILTSGALTYTSDERFQVAHSPGGDDWTLHVKYVQKRDNGTYECQVATGSGTISHYFNLHVVVPAAFILGSDEHHIGEGSTISLVCIIEHSPVPPQYVFWYHNERMINYDTQRGGVAVSTEPGPKTHSRLVISSAARGDSGNYTCRASNTEPDTVHVFVSTGDNTAAIQRQESSCPAARPPLLLAAQLAGCALLLWAVRVEAGSRRSSTRLADGCWPVLSAGPPRLGAGAPNPCPATLQGQRARARDQLRDGSARKLTHDSIARDETTRAASSLCSLTRAQ
ncbi:hemicentin-2-like [Bacillus rossius redtenbacheri]|uniref:hemicentin-2-like n=1 Tax=Bacillus rossius redtenbacheri TaxID=93214 RepID=UPI002FDE424B